MVGSLERIKFAFFLHKPFCYARTVELIKKILAITCFHQLKFLLFFSHFFPWRQKNKEPTLFTNFLLLLKSPNKEKASFQTLLYIISLSQTQRSKKKYSSYSSLLQGSPRNTHLTSCLTAYTSIVKKAQTAENYTPLGRNTTS